MALNKNLSKAMANKKVSQKLYDNVKYKPKIYDDDIYSQLPLTVIELNQNYTEAKAPPIASKLVHYDSPTPGTTNDLTIGTLVEISNDVTNDPLYGVIRWMGVHPKSKQVLVGIELEEEQGHLPLPLCDGVHNGQRFFKCGENRGIFVPLSQCHKDSRFIDEIPTTSAHHVSDKMFGKEVRCMWCTNLQFL